MSKLLTIQDVSNYLGIPVQTLYQWRTKGYGPPGRRIGKHVRYREAYAKASLKKYRPVAARNDALKV